MNSSIRFISSSLLILTFFLFTSGCKKSDSTPTSTVPTYAVSVTVLNATAQPQGGVLVTLKVVPYSDPKFVAYTDSLGKATLQAPAGNQTFIAKIGSAYDVEFTLNVSTTATNVVPPVTLVRNTAIKVLVVKASAEQLEAVLRDPKIGFTNFDETNIDTLRLRADADSTALLNYLKQYTLVFSDCDGSTEGGSDYALLSRVYGRYVTGGGNMYGGHYNYFHLQRIWTSSYQKFNSSSSITSDTLALTDTDISKFVGFSVAQWNSNYSLSGYYDKFDDLPSNAKVYAKISGITPAVYVIVENHIGTGKYLWTNYHNQDVKDDAKLIKLVQYFLLSL
jgi:hypothetical protein